MSKINLLGTVQGFYYTVENLNNPNSKEMADVKSTFIFAKEKIEILNAKTLEAVAEWKIHQNSSPSNEDANIVADRIKIKQQAKLIKYGGLALQILAACVCTIAFMTFIISYPYLASILLVGGTAGAVIHINKSKATIGSKAFPEGYVAYAVQLMSQKIALNLNRLKVICQNRLNNSENFRQFVEKFVKTDEFKVNESALLNMQLHVIYLKYKFALQSIIKESAIKTEAF